MTWITFSLKARLNPHLCKLIGHNDHPVVNTDQEVCLRCGRKIIKIKRGELPIRQDSPAK